MTSLNVWTVKTTCSPKALPALHVTPVASLIVSSALSLQGYVKNVREILLLLMFSAHVWKEFRLGASVIVAEIWNF